MKHDFGELVVVVFRSLGDKREVQLRSSNIYGLLIPVYYIFEDRGSVYNSVLRFKPPESIHAVVWMETNFVFGSFTRKPYLGAIHSGGFKVQTRPKPVGFFLVYKIL